MENLFGTDGIRGTIGSDFFVHENIHAFGIALGAWACKSLRKKPTIIILHDTRSSCSYLKATLASGILRHPTHIYDAQVLPTPAAYFLQRKYTNIDLAIIISASHNPAQDNGIKIIMRTGKLSKEAEQEISTLFYHYKNTAFCNTYTNLGTMSTLESAERDYMAALEKTVPKNIFKDVRVVLDCAHGATYHIAPKIFKKLGAHVIAYNTQPTGSNINKDCGSTYPQKLQQAVISCDADIGFAFDGDGDRVIAVSRTGEIKDGDDILALLLNHPRYKNTSTVVGTIMTNCGLENFVKKRNKNLIRTAVGDKYISRSLQENNLLLGGEASGHIIMHDICTTGDGILVALHVLETHIKTKNWNMCTFDHTPQIHTKIPVKRKKDLSNVSIKNIIDQAQERISPGRLIVRYSGTENILRIMTESDNKELGNMIAQDLAQELSNMLI